MTPFLIADRGHCSFVNKVRHMEDSGAAIGIVIDNYEDDVSTVVMTDDGSGSGIRIPSMLIGKADGEILIDFMKTANDSELESLVLMAKFEMHRPDNRVEYDIWFSASD